MALFSFQCVIRTQKMSAGPINPAGQAPLAMAKAQGLDRWRVWPPKKVSANLSLAVGGEHAALFWADGIKQLVVCGRICGQSSDMHVWLRDQRPPGEDASKAGENRDPDIIHYTPEHCNF